jgi:nucleoside-diphosphate-sugar epimerase
MEAQPSTQPVALVTGSSSLIGTRAVVALSADYRVVALDAQPPAQPLRDVDWISCDLTEAQSIAEGLAAVRTRHGDRLASVLHLATYADFSGEPRPLPYALVVDGTRLLLQGLQEFHVEQFLFAGSLFVMQPPTEPRAFLTEDSPTEATWDYARWQLDAAQAVQHDSDRMPTVILRIANVYDEDCRAPFLAYFLRRIYEQHLGSHVFPGELLNVVKRMEQDFSKSYPWGQETPSNSNAIRTAAAPGH